MIFIVLVVSKSILRKTIQVLANSLICMMLVSYLQKPKNFEAAVGKENETRKVFLGFYAS